MHAPPHAVILDFNGTLSDDEPLLDRLFREVLLEEAGVELTSESYFGELSGLSDPEIAERALGMGGVEATEDLCDRVLQGKVARYKEEVRRELPVGPDAIAFVRGLAGEIPVGIASGALREEIDLVLELAGIRDLFSSVICIDDIDCGKPDPESYLLALAKLNGRRSMTESIVARDTLAIEDSGAGVAAAWAAGMGCAAMAGDRRAEEEAGFVIERLDAEQAGRLLAGAEPT